MKHNRLKAKEKRKVRIRAKVLGKRSRPRLTVFRSNKYMFAQIIDDQKGTTLISANEREVKTKTKEEKLTKLKKAMLLGELIAQKAALKKIKKIAFDRGAYKYHGRVKALAQGARKEGLKF